MNYKLFFILVFSILFYGITAQNKTDNFWESENAYLGQKNPKLKPEIFAPGIISSKNHEHSSPAFSPDGKEIYWSVFIDSKQIIYFCKYSGKKWTEPKIAEFSGNYSDGGPCFSNNGNQIYFYSQRPIPGKGEKLFDDLWYVDKNFKKWDKPKNLGISNITNREKWIFSPTISNNGNIYLTGNNEGVHAIFFIKKIDENFSYPKILDRQINSDYDNFNWTPFIAPDESYLIFSSKRSDSFGFNDLYICFRTNSGQWSKPVNLGSEINNGSQVRFPNVSPDGKYLFFTRAGSIGRDDVYWVSSGIIEKLKNKIQAD